MICTCPESAFLKIWLKSFRFEGKKNSFEDWWHFYRVFAVYYDDFDVPDCGWCPKLQFGLSEHPWWSYVQNLVEIQWVWGHQEPCQRSMTFQEFWLELMMIPDWGWCPWWRFGWSAYALRKLCLKFGWILLSLKASRMVSKMDDIAWCLEDTGGSRLMLMSMIRIRRFPSRSNESLFQILWRCGA